MGFKLSAKRAINPAGLPVILFRFRVIVPARRFESALIERQSLLTILWRMSECRRRE